MDVGNVYVIGGHGSMNSHTLSRHNGFISLVNYNNGDNIEMNEDFNNGCVSCGIGLINIHIVYQCN